MSDWESATELLALMDLPGVGPARALAVSHGEVSVEDVDVDHALPKLLDRARERTDECESAGVSVLGFFDESFPAALRDIPQPPAVLYVRGATEWPDRALAVVGTREPTTFGETATTKLARAAASRGVAIISGLALGIDATAHEAALAENGLTIAVLGCGLDAVSPRQHRDLAHRILDSGGSLVSEQPFGIRPGARTLVARNRLQSGLAKALLVGQTGVKGGTMHTVRFAAQQGRPIFCPVPHAPSEKSAGLEVLLNRPARELPDALPAWRSHRSLAERLGMEPLANPVTADTIASWVEELAGLSGPATPDNGGEQLRLDP